MDKVILTRLIHKGFTIPEIACQCDRSRTNVSHYLKKYGLKPKKRGNSKAIPRERLEKYVSQGLTGKEIAKIIHCSSTTALAWIKRYGITKPSGPDFYSEEWRLKFDRHITEGRTLDEICELERIKAKGVLFRYIKYHGLKTAIAQDRNSKKQPITVEIQEAILARVKRGESYSFIAKQIGVSIYFVKEICHQYGFLRPSGFNRNTISYPCEHLKAQLLSAGISFQQEVQPLTNRKFRIDIALSDAKIGIEVNGNFHYEDGEEATILAPYYQERHDLIEASGWRLVEVFFRKVWDQTYVQELITTIKTAVGETNQYALVSTSSGTTNGP